MTLTVNGELRQVPDGLTVATLVTQLGVRGRVAVELNGEVLRQAQHPEVALRDGDALEVGDVRGWRGVEAPPWTTHWSSRASDSAPACSSAPGSIRATR